MRKINDNFLKNVFFYTILVCFIALFFYFNQYSVNQQFIFSKLNEQIVGTNFGKLIAGDILKYHRYIYTFIDGFKPIFYPLWGYPLLILFGIKIGNSALFLYVLQALLVLHGVHLFYRFFDIKKRAAHIFLFIPFIGILSIKWPDGIVCYLGFLIFYLLHKGFLTKKIRYFIYSGAAWGLLSNFRSEYFLLPFFVLPFFIIFNKKLQAPAKFIFTGLVVIIAVQFMLLLPWAARSFMYDGKVRFTASNGGGTLYDSLGELPGNPWGLDGDDTDAYKYAQSHDKNGNPVPLKEIKPGSEDFYPVYAYSGMKYRINFYPFGHEGDDILKKEAVRLIRQHPYYFAKKVAHHFLSIFAGGVYTSEFECFGVTTGKLLESVRHFRDLSKEGKAAYLFDSLKYEDNRRIAFPYILNWVFRFIFLILLIFFIISPAMRQRKIENIFYLLLPVIVYKILLVSFMQYSPRHLNFVYMFLLGYFLLCIETRRKAD